MGDSPAVPKYRLFGPILAVVCVVLLALFSAGVMIWEEQQRGSLRLAVCEEVEAIKRHLREDAKKDYENLDRTLRLLNLKRTPEIERAALDARDDVLLRFAPLPGGCRVTLNLR